MKTIKKAIMPTILVTLIFFLNYYVFGMENTIIGPFLTLSFLKFRNMEDYLGCMLRSFGIYAVMAMAAWLALLHPVLNVLCNGAALFWIGYFLIDEYNPLNYFPSGMALIFFQISPVPGRLLPLRILALFVSFFLVFLFLEFSRLLTKPQRMVERLAKEGLGLGEEMLDALETGDYEKADSLRLELCRINREISLKIYESNRSSLKKVLVENGCCDYIACFQMMNYLATVILEQDVGEGKVQLEQLGRLLSEFKEADPKPRPHLYFRENPLDIRSFRLRFALRQVIVMTPCLLYGCLCPWKNGYWLAISVFFMMIPVYESTFLRVSQRILGSLVGIAVCLVVYTVFPGFWARVALMTIANFFIYCSGNYASMVACITCSALAMKLGTDTDLLVLGQRFFYTLAGAVIAVAANLWVFRIRAWRQCQYVMELLNDLKGKMQQAAELIEETKRRKELDQMLVKSYLLSSRMQEFNDMANVHRRDDVDSFLKEHMLFTSRLILSKYVMKTTSIAF